MDAVTLSAAVASTKKSLGTITVTARAGETAAGTVTRVNAALSALSTFGGRKRVKLVGDFTINAPLVIGSSTTLDAYEAKVTLAAGSNSMMLRTPAAAATGTITQRVSDVVVLGGVWDRGANIETADNTSHSLVFRGVDRLTIRDVTYYSTAGKYGICVQNANNFVIEDCRFPAAASDGIHVQGPASHFFIRNIMGTTGDDLVGVTPRDYSKFLWGDEGDVTDGYIQRLALVNGLTRAVNLCEGNGRNIRRITIDGVRGNITGNTTKAMIYVGRDTGEAGTQGGTIDGITIRDVKCVVPSNKAMIEFQAGGTHSNLLVEDVEVVADCAAVVRVSGPGTIDHLSLRYLRGSTSTAPCPVVQFLFNNAAKVNRLTMTDVNVKMAGTMGNSVIDVASPPATHTLGQLDLIGVVTNNNNYLLNTATTTVARLSHCSYIAAVGTYNLAATATVTAKEAVCDLHATNVVATGGVLTRG